MITTLIFAALIPLSFSLSAPAGGFCPASQYITTDSYILDTTASYNATAYPSPIIATVTFARAQGDILYQVALNFQNLDYQIINYRISIMIKYTNPRLSSFDVNVYSAFTNRIRLIGFRYMVINSNASYYLSVSYINFTPNYIGNSATNTSALLPFPRINTSYYVTFTGLDFDYSAIQEHYLRIYSVTFNQSSATIGIRSADTQCSLCSIMMYYFSLLFVRYRNNTAINISQFGFGIQSSSTLSHILIHTKNTLSGLGYIFATNQLFYNFNSSVINGSLSATSMNLFIVYSCALYNIISVLTISKYYQNCCIFPTSYLYPINKTCYDICPPRLYGASNFSCLLCPFDCYYCNNNGNGACISCLQGDYRTLNIVNKRCIANLGYYSDGNISRAKRCAYDCIQCTSLTVCKICVAGKSPVTGGCSNVFGCAQVSVNFTINATKCIACKNEFVLTKASLCSCPGDTWMVTGHCTNIIGCLATIRIDNVTQCAACKLRFFYSNNQCVCVYGFKLQDSGDECIQICGDGILFVLKCDDGNLIDGDGCSSKCKIEPNYKCFDGSQNHSSLCFINQNYSIVVDSIDKTPDKNQGIFVFKVIPISRKEIISSLTFSCHQNITLSNWNFDNNLITVTIDYHQDLQGNLANLSLKLNQKYVFQAYLNISFKMKSGGTQLIIVESYDSIQIIRRIIFAISIYVLLLFVVGSIAHKMIGVQTLNTFQMILFTLTVNTKYTPSYNILNYLSPVSGNYYYFANYQSSYYFCRPSLISLSTYNQDSVLLTMEVTAGIFIGFLFINFGRMAFRVFFGKKNCGGYIQKFAQFSYNNILFPSAIGLLFINVFSNILSQSANQLHTIILHLFVTITTSLVFFYQLLFLFISKPPNVESDYRLIYDNSPLANSVPEDKDRINISQRCTKIYIPCYLLFIYVEFNIFLLMNMHPFAYSSSITTAIALIFFIWFISQKPYQDTIHNIGQIFNLVLILLFGLWSILRQVFPTIAAENNQIAAVYCFLGLMTAVLLLTTTRVIVQIRRKFICPDKAQSNEVQTKQTGTKRQKINSLSTQYRKKDQYMNPYSIKAQLLREQQLRWDEFNKQRIKNNTEPLIGDKFHLVQKSQDVSLADKNVQPAFKKETKCKDRRRERDYLLQRKIKE